jgi:hypothetical protein
MSYVFQQKDLNCHQSVVPSTQQDYAVTQDLYPVSAYEILYNHTRSKQKNLTDQVQPYIREKNWTHVGEHHLRWSQCVHAYT